MSDEDKSPGQDGVVRAIAERFRGAFLESAHVRIGRCERLVASGDAIEWGTMASELHGVAGEAAILGHAVVCQHARELELAVRRALEPAKGPTDEARARLRDGLASLRAAVEAL